MIKNMISVKNKYWLIRNIDFDIVNEYFGCYLSKDSQIRNLKVYYKCCEIYGHDNVIWSYMPYPDYVDSLNGEYCNSKEYLESRGI